MAITNERDLQHYFAHHPDRLFPGCKRVWREVDLEWPKFFASQVDKPWVAEMGVLMGRAAIEDAEEEIGRMCEAAWPGAVVAKTQDN